MSVQNMEVSSILQKVVDLIAKNKLQEAKDLLERLCKTHSQEAEAWYLLSTVNGQIGKIDEAGECCRRALEIQPIHCEARINLGNVLYTQGKQDEAIEQYHKVLQLNPMHAMAHNNLGLLFAEKHRYDEASKNYQNAIQLDPNLVVAYINLGKIRMLEEQYQKAANNFFQAIRLNPGDPSLYNLLGTVQIKLEKTDEALANFKEAIRLKPDYIDAYINLGNLYLEHGNHDKALDTYQQALRNVPNSAEIFNAIGVIYLERGKSQIAFNNFRQALVLNPYYTLALINMGTVSRSPARFGSYLELYGELIDRVTDPERARLTFIENMKHIRPTEYDPWLDQELIKCFSIPDANHEALAFITGVHLKNKYLIDSTFIKEQRELRDIIDQIASDDLFITFLQKTFNVDPDLEFLLTDVRRYILNEYCRKNSSDAQEMKTALALAFQGLNNEYIFTMATEEQTLVSDLKNSIEQLAITLDAPSTELEAKLYIYGMYEQLSNLGCSQQLNSLPSAGWSIEFNPLLERALTIPLEEEAIKNDIVSLEYIEDKTSRLVQSQYEENPYPRWLSLPNLKKRNIKRVLKQTLPYFSPPGFLDGPIKILVAGCGTGQQPIQTALTYDNVEILAVDISKSSLAHAIRMARHYSVNNIKFLHSDILQLAKLDTRFHIIECTGVLHHMEDPMQGWKVLCGLLVENGLMSIGLYSEKSRKGIVEAREIIQRENIFPDKNNIRNFRRRIMRHEMGEELYKLTHSVDFFSTSPCRDLIFHFKEHRYTLPQLERALADLNLEFLGFEFLESGETINAYRQQYPQDTQMTNLALWDEFETQHPNTFSRLYDFWCRRKT